MCDVNTSTIMSLFCQCHACYVVDTNKTLVIVLCSYAVILGEEFSLHLLKTIFMLST